MKFRLVAVAVGAAATFASPAFAGDFNYADFSNTDGLSFNNHAKKQTAGGRDVARITPATIFQSGSVFAQEKISLKSSFSTSFNFNMNGHAPNSFGGGDGLAFVVQNHGADFYQVGGLGYQGNKTVFAVEFDTYNNGSNDGHSDNHVAIHNGSYSPLAIDKGLPFSLESGDISAWLDYDATNGRFEVRYSANGVRPELASLSYAIDLSSLLGSDDAFIGFTSSTGGGYSNHDLVSWSFAQQAAVPEPASWAMMIGGFALIGGAMRRRPAMRLHLT